jgi:hypothetical protein
MFCYVGRHAAQKRGAIMTRAWAIDAAGVLFLALVWLAWLLV